MSRKALDLAGKKFGRLTVETRGSNSKQGAARWYCRCDCGKQTLVIASMLVTDNGTISCGCIRKDPSRKKTRANFIDMVGYHSGRLTVIERGPNKEDGTAQWICKCDCGSPKQTLLTGRNLRKNVTKSCGCLWQEHIDWMVENQGELLAEYRNRGTPQATCHPDRPHASRGLCAECYYQVKRTYNPERDKATAKARRER